MRSGALPLGNAVTRLYAVSLFILLVIIALAKLSIGIYPRYRDETGLGLRLLGYAPEIIRFSAAMILTVFGMILIKRHGKDPADSDVSDGALLAVVASGLATLFPIALLRQPNMAEHSTALAALMLLMWAAFFASCANLASVLLRSVASRRLWLDACVVGAAAVLGSRVEYFFADIILRFLVEPTAHLVVGAYDLLGGSAAVERAINDDPPHQEILRLDIDGFEVKMALSCAGYAGALIAMGVCAVYMWIIRDRLIWPRALIIFPVLAVSMFLMNAVRIFVLLMIGKYISPAVAYEGFHIYAGWIYLLTHTTAVIYWFETSRWVSRDPLLNFRLSDTFGPRNPDDLVLIAPLIVFLVLSIILGAVSTNMNWFYPIGVIASGAVTILYLPRAMSLSKGGGELMAVAIGIVVAAIWFAMIPEDPISSGETAVNLSSVPVWAAAVWLVFRFIGAVVLIPVIEEMAFRGAVQPRLAQFLSGSAGKKAAATISIVVTSLLFGFLHSAFIAGTVAGLLYGWLRYRTGTLLAPVIAHAVTNFIISFYVLAAGAWSYW